MNKRIISLVLFLIIIFSGGCSSIPTPGATMKPPSVSETAGIQDHDYKKEVMDYLPAGAKLEDVNNASIFPVDVDGDLNPEYLATYRLDESRVGAFLLKKSASTYKVIWTDVGKGYSFDTVKIADVTGDGLAEILIGWTIGSSAGNALDVLSWRNNTLQNIYRTAYHRMDVEDIDGYYGKDGIAEVALWIKDTEDAYNVQVLRWNERDKDFESAPDVYQAYYPRVVQYYKDKVRTMPDVRVYWYYLGIAQYRAGQFNDAVDAVSSGLKVKSDYPNDMNFFLLKADILRDMGRLDEAAYLYDGLIPVDEKSPGPVSPKRMIAWAYFGKGEISRVRGNFDEALEYYKKAQEQSMEIEIRRAINRLPVYKTVQIVENYFKNQSTGRFNGEKFVEWARDNSTSLVYKDINLNINGISRIVFVDYMSEGLMKAHEIFWWDRGRLRYQLVFSNEFPTEAAFTSAIYDCRVAQGTDNSLEAGMIIETSHLGNSAPKPYYIVMRLTDDRWKLVWRPPVYKWRNSHGIITFNGPGLNSIILQGDSWRLNDGKGRIFNEESSGPHRHFTDTWERNGDSYKLVDARTIPSAYNTLVEFIYRLSTGREDATKTLVVDQDIIEKAKELNLIQPGLNERWSLELDGQEAETKGPLKILDGPAAGVTFIFEQSGENWLIKDIVK
ncbi:MAG: tetratricopeptide repeat protein [Thermoanaerobacteraceae bacterium]|nr:tetratricopeptide repeat protein [Thermoanaerobacteraceae bacterium]